MPCPSNRKDEQGKLDEGHAMNCPRCSTELKSHPFDQATVQSCPSCEGAWFPDEALATVTDNTLSELESSELSPSLVGDKLEKIDPDKLINCPQCDVQMERFRYSLTCDVVLDECPAHGIWLDDGELGTLMKFLTNLYDRVEEREAKIIDGLSGGNLQALEELTTNPSYYNLPTSLLETIKQVHARRSE